MEAVAETKDSNSISFNILLHDDPFELRARIAGNVHTDISMSLRPDPSMFALQLTEPRDGGDEPQPQNIPVFLEVPTIISADNPSLTPLIEPQVTSKAPRL